LLPTFFLISFLSISFSPSLPVLPELCTYTKHTNTHSVFTAVTIRNSEVLSWSQTRLKLEKTKIKLHGLSPRANYTFRATAACRRSDCQLLRIEDATWSA
jgi:hypothetical protein